MGTGRPTLYKPEYDDQAFNYALLGATDKEMAAFFDVSESTFNLWKLEHPTFSESLKAGKEDADSKVTRSLYNRAIGYTHIVEKPMVVSLGQGLGSEVKIIRYTETVLPDTTAQIYWTKNRRPKNWRANPEGDDQNKQMLEKIDSVLDKINEVSKSETD